MSRTAVVVSILAALGVRALQAQSTELAPGLFVHATPAGNIATYAGTDGAFVIGPLSVATTPAIQADLAQRTTSPMRYVLALAFSDSRTEGDGGWSRSGAFVTTQELAFNRFGGPAGRPPTAFSQFIKFNIGSESIHCVHQPPGHDRADVLVHFENSGVVYLGESLAGDGYPLIDSAQGGNLDSLISTLDPWAGPGRIKFIPARGPALTAADVQAYRDMLTAMRDRVRAMKQAGRSVDDVVAAHPAAEFDSRWGHGRVSTEAFVRSVYRGVAGR